MTDKPRISTQVCLLEAKHDATVFLLELILATVNLPNNQEQLARHQHGKQILDIIQEWNTSYQRIQEMGK